MVGLLIPAIILIMISVTAHGLSPPDFVSPWHPITAYSNPEVVINHNLGEMPMKLDVQVQVSHPVHGTITILATGSGQIGSDPTKPYGGVIYLYNSNSVKIMAPGPSTCTSSSCRGGVAYFSDAGFTGPSAVSGVIQSGNVRVRAWKTCTFVKPSAVSAGYPISSTTTNNYRKISSGVLLDLVLVKVFFDDDWIMDAQGTVSLTDGSNVGGVQYVYDTQHVYVRTPSNGKVFSGVGWGSSGDLVYTNGTVRVYSWSFMELENDPVLETVLYSGTTNPTLQKMTYNPTNQSIIFIVYAASRNLNNFGLKFPLSGTAMTNGEGITGKYGSSFFAYDEHNVYFWRPSSDNGCGTLVGGQWASNVLDGVTDCSPSPDVHVKFMLAAVEELPCGEKGCNGLPAGPFCDCEGTGFEGQYCTMPVACPILVPGVDAVMAIFEDREYKYLEWVTFSCLEGYQYSSGSENRSCLANATWSGEPYTCTPIPCPDAEPAILGFINGTYNNWFGENVTYACNPGHDILSGNIERTCLANATWSGSPPECALSCGYPVPPPMNAYQTNSGRTYGEVAKFACNKGYEYDSGDTAMLCQTTGLWNGTALSCKKKECGWPSNGTNADISEVSGTAYQDVVRYKCHPGYNYYHSYNAMYYTTITKRCLSNGKWDSPPTCNKVNCGDPGTPQNAVLDHTRSTVGNYEYASIQSYSCHLGYGLVNGGLEIECTQYGNWSNTAPSCDIRKCSYFGNVSNGQVYYQGLEYLNYAVTVCDQGYAIASGSSSRMCDAGGYWTGTDAVCQQISIIYFINPGNTNTTLPSLDELEDLKKAIRIDRRNTSAYLRSLNSQDDPRPSALAIGVSGLLILLGICGYICSLDLIKHVRVNGKVKVTQGMKQNPDAIAKNGTSDNYVQKGKNKEKGRNDLDESNSVDNVEHIYA